MTVQPPTREQIAKAIEGAFSNVNTGRFHEGAGSMTAILHVTSRYERAVKDAVLALFPQPTPSAERSTCGDPRPHEAHEGDTGFGDEPDIDWVHWSCPGVLLPAEPVSIADMAPGTTFTADLLDDRIDGPRLRRVWRVQESPGVLWNDEQNYGIRIRRVDPSTIRDVTPPPATPEEGDRG